MYSIKIDNQEANIYLYSAILGDMYDSTIHDVINALNEFKGNVINLHINSEGGDIFEAQGFYSYLRNHKANVNVYIEGICASAASIIAMAGNKIYMPENSLFMIHNPSGSVFGESEDMRKLADILDKIRDSMAVIYEAKTGKSHDEILAMMNAETWLSAKEAKRAGFIDVITPAREIAASAKTYNDGVLAERDRLRALDELNAPGREQMIYTAKYETFKAANEIALDLLRLDTRRADAVNIAPDFRAESNSAINSVSKIINKMRGYK